MDWGDLRLFLAIARLGSVRAAAAELGVNQSTVNRRMDVLEHDLNLTLFDRTTRGFMLTETGAAIAVVAGPMQAQAEAVHTEADRLRRKLTGTLMLTGPQALGVTFAAPVIAEFRRHYPDVMVAYDGSERRLDLLAGEADIAFRAGFTQPEGKLVSDMMLPTDWSVYCSAEFARRSGMPSGLDEVGRFAVVALGGLIGASPANAWFMALVDPDRVTGMANSVPNMAAILHAGLGIGILPCVVGDNESGLMRCFEPVPELRSWVWLTTTPEARRNPRVAAFVKVALKWFREHADELVAKPV
jgi:DNA-binding transcriptional LysR family regulator